MRLSEQQREWLTARVPDAPRSFKGERPPMDKCKALRGIFWILDNGAKWKDLPKHFGAKSSDHKCFTLWVTSGVFDGIMRRGGTRVVPLN